jgi:LysM repeat protein
MNTAEYLLLVLIMGFAGCVTLDDRLNQTSEEEARAQAALEKSRANMERLLERVEAIERRQQDLQEEIQSLKASEEKRDRETKDNLAATGRALSNNEAAQAKMRQEIIDSVAKNVSELMKARSASSGTAKTETGREHVVQPGETLSAIAVAYKVKVNAIIQANGLKNGASLKAGQKLFIPEAGSAR